MVSRCLRQAPSLAAILLMIAAAGVGGCASAEGEAGGRSPFATLIIENDSPSTVNVYALRSGTRQRIGTVSGLSTQEFPLRQDHLGPGRELRVGVDPVGSSRLYTSDRIVVNEGDVIEMNVSSFLR